MKITATKIKKILEKEYGWSDLLTDKYSFINLLIKDTLKAVDTILKAEKGISIRK